MSCRRGAAGKQLDNDSCLLILSSLAYSGSDEERLGQVTERNVDIASGGDNVVPHTHEHNKLLSIMSMSKYNYGFV